jgi:hypothetical protein
MTLKRTVVCVVPDEVHRLPSAYKAVTTRIAEVLLSPEEEATTLAAWGRNEAQHHIDAQIRAKAERFRVLERKLLHALITGVQLNSADVQEFSELRAEVERTEIKSR